MLNIELCKKCISKGSVWIDSDDNRESNGEVYCLYAKRDAIKNLKIDEPPKDCPFILEHLMKSVEKA